MPANINKLQLLDLSSLHFMDRHENLLFIGGSGIGRTHLATATGMKSCKPRFSMYFITCHDLIGRLIKAYQENRHKLFF
ncbi:ATP-binding protein [Listeria rocourtiae]|uniref:ATP-binding protein n=1 Tax=Listeria rocourtiae TaxID=647910 RepID=UPI0035DB0220